MARKLTMDRVLVGVILLLTLFGLVMVYSSSVAHSLDRTGSGFYYLLKQLAAAILGMTLLFLVTRFDYRRLRQRGVLWPALALCVVLLMMALATHDRWLRLGMFSFQPSELTRLVLLVYLADLLVRKQDDLRTYRGFLLPTLGTLAAFCGLILLTPDLGTTVTIGVTVFCLFFMAGVPLSRLSILGLIGAIGFFVLAWGRAYRWQRLVDFFWSDELHPQVVMSLNAVGSGGMTGVGLGESKQKLFFLPEAHNDFIFAVIGEELGLIGCALLVAAFLVLLWRGVRIALRAPDAFGAYLAAGITLSLVLQAFINMGVVLALLPTKGLTLPFISYGGTSLLVSLLAAGLALNVSQHAR